MLFIAIRSSYTPKHVVSLDFNGFYLGKHKFNMTVSHTVCHKKVKVPYALVRLRHFRGMLAIPSRYA